MITADRRIRRGLRNRDQKPSSIRSVAVRLGARLRDRLMIRSCCFKRRLSATMALEPPGPRRLARVVKRCMSNNARSFMVKQGRADCYRAQDLSFVCFFARSYNSPPTGRRRWYCACNLRESRFPRQLIRLYLLAGHNLTKPRQGLYCSNCLQFRKTAAYSVHY